MVRASVGRPRKSPNPKQISTSTPLQRTSVIHQRSPNKSSSSSPRRGRGRPSGRSTPSTRITPARRGKI